MPLVSHVKIQESLPEKTGQRYVTYHFTTNLGDSERIGPVLEDPETDIIERAAEFERHALNRLAAKERHVAYSLAKDKKINPTRFPYQYNTVADVYHRLYKQPTAEESEVVAVLGKFQNFLNKLKTFLGRI